MDRRSFLKTAAGATGALSALPLVNLSCSGKSGKLPNIVLIMADDMGYSDIGCYGGEINTPNLDRLAQGGLRFTQFYNNAKCAPTRASLLTGLYSQQVGVHGPPAKMNDCVTIAEVLKQAGYRTLMTGKWHAEQLPVERGFDRYYGLCDGCCNFFNPGEQREGEPAPAHKRYPRKWAEDHTVIQPYTPDDPDFYTTDAFTEYALRYLDEYGSEEQPFFLYLAYTAPHYPLHARPEDIEKYRNRYIDGWDVLREERYRRMIEMGLIDPELKMSSRDENAQNWDDVQNKEEWALKMAVYAAMVDRMDKNIGRILAKIRELDEEENTIVMFLSDNGGCAEQVNLTPDVPPGPVNSYRTVDLEWANAQNTPFRKFKRWDHEGGISTPFIVHWPEVIKTGGAITDQPGHIIDVMATILDIADVGYPASYHGRNVLPLKGKSLLPVFLGKKRKEHEMLCWEFNGARAIRKGDWKLVDFKDQEWELYDIKKDRTELHNLADQHPEIVKELEGDWIRWAQECNVPSKSY